MGLRFKIVDFCIRIRLLSISSSYEL